MSSKFSNLGGQIDLHGKEKEKQLTQRTSLLSVKNLPTHQKGNFASDGSQSLSIPFPNSIKKKKGWEFIVRLSRKEEKIKRST